MSTEKLGFKLHDLPHEGSAVRKLGKRLAELLDEDQWAECEQILFEISDEMKAADAIYAKCHSELLVIHEICSCGWAGVLQHPITHGDTMTVRAVKIMATELIKGRAVPDTTLQFLTDVVTAAGLLSHGKTDKALAKRISDGAFRIRIGTGPSNEKAEVSADTNRMPYLQK